MPDELDTPSNGVSDAAQPASEGTATPEATPDAPSASSREALEKAFAQVGDEGAKEPSEKPKDAPVEAKEPDADKKDAEPKQGEDGRLRGPDGKFLPKAKEGEAEPKPEGQEGEPVTPVDEPKEPSELDQPPERFSKAAQDAWKQTPEIVRAEVDRAIAEMTAGIEKYKPVAEAYESIKRYDDMAKESGTTLSDALDNYVGLENMIRENPLNGFAVLCQNMGIDRRQLGQALMQMEGQPQRPQEQKPDPNITETAQQVQQLTSMFSQWQTQQFIDRFASEHPGFYELEEDITKMLETGYAKDLPDAYQKAMRLRPDRANAAEGNAAQAAQPQPKPQPDPAQTREKAALSPSGAPSNGSDPSTTKPAGSPREAIERAFSQLS